MDEVPAAERAVKAIDHARSRLDLQGSPQDSAADAVLGDIANKIEEAIKVRKSQHTSVITRYINKKRFFAVKPTKVGTVGGWTFYECPWHGDENPLVAVKGDACGYSVYHELPSANELQ